MIFKIIYRCYEYYGFAPMFTASINHLSILVEQPMPGHSTIQPMDFPTILHGLAEFADW